MCVLQEGGNGNFSNENKLNTGRKEGKKGQISNSDKIFKNK